MGFGCLAGLSIPGVSCGAGQSDTPACPGTADHCQPTRCLPKHLLGLPGHPRGWCGLRTLEMGFHPSIPSRRGVQPSLTGPPGTEHVSPLCSRGINLGTSFLPSTLFPGCFFLLKQDVAGKTHAPFPVFPSNYSAKEHLAAADERATPACRGGGADFPAAAGGSWQMPLPPRCLSSHSTGRHWRQRGQGPASIVPRVAEWELGRGGTSATSFI